MALFKLFGSNPRDPLEQGLDFGPFDPSIVQSTPGRVVLFNPFTDYTIDFSGFGLVLREFPFFQIGGTITGFTINNPVGEVELEASNINWSFAQFAQAADELFDPFFFDQEESAFVALLSQQPLTIDASERFAFTDIELTEVTSSSTFITSSTGSFFAGGDGDDLVQFTPRTDGVFASHIVEASPGNDVFDITALPRDSYVGLNYFDAPIPIVANFDGFAGTGTITKGRFGTDTVRGFTASDSIADLGIRGTGNDDVFSVSGVGGFFEIAPGGGNTTMNIGLNAGGMVQLNYGYSAFDRNPDGIVMDLRTGVVANDGFGGRDQINVTGDNGWLEIHGTDNSDQIIGSDREEWFILGGGNSTLDGGGGRDVLRFDRDGYGSGVSVDLQQGTATGEWFGDSFRHTVSNIEEVWGSQGNDLLIAADSGSRLEGRGGNNTLIGGEGTDFLLGGSGNDRLDPGNNTDFDVIDPGAGFNTVTFANSSRGFFTIEHWDLADQAPTTASINGRGNAGFIIKDGLGETVIEDVQNALNADGLLLVGSHFGDSFEVVNLEDGHWLEIQGGRGENSYSIEGDGRVRLSFDNDAHWNPATQGLIADLSTGVIENNGFGFRNTLDADAETQIDIRGTMHGDRITGRDGTDLFIPLGGNDTLDGGGGFNLVSYNQREAGPVQIDLGAGIARGTFDGVAFTDTMTNIQGALGSRFEDSWLAGSDEANYLRGFNGNDSMFGDGFFAAYTMGFANQVYRLYEATLGRAPDAGGHAGWTELLAQGSRSAVDVANSFVISREFQNTYGDLDNASFVNLLYQNVLGREADAGGLAGWLDALETGQSRAQVVLGFSDSREFVNATNQDATEFAMALNPANWQGDVYRLYLATLGREPDLGGFKGWIDNIVSGTSYLDAVAGFVGSREFQNTYGELDDQGFVSLLYQNVLGREADAGGLAGWVSALEDGTSRAEVVNGFARSGEFVRNTAPGLRDWIRAQGEDDYLDSNGGENDLWGGILADVFRFRAAEEGTHRVHDFEPWDYLDFRGFGYSSNADATAFMTQRGADVVFEDQGTTVILANTQLASLDSDTFLFS